MAEIAALEFLFPYKERFIQSTCPKTQEEMLKIATFYRVPLVMVEKYMSDPWMEFLKSYSRQ